MVYLERLKSLMKEQRWQFKNRTHGVEYSMSPVCLYIYFDYFLEKSIC